MNEIVVGVDGSDPSKQALRWALGQARLTGAVLLAITAWEYPALYGWGPTYPYQDFAQNAGKGLSDTIREVVGEDPPIEVRESVIAGHPAQVLIDASRKAQLLVVGSRGVGGVTAALLGSVSQHCVQHASCPVVVVRTPNSRP